MKVMKFGGTSVGSVDAVLAVKRIVEKECGEVVVVVAALDGITDQLLYTAKLASLGEKRYEEMFDAISKRHMDLVMQVVNTTCRDSVSENLLALLGELSNILRGVYLIRDISDKTSNTILSYGERLSGVIIGGVIDGAVMYDPREFIKTSKYFNKHSVEFGITDKLISEAFKSLTKVGIVPGFISTDIETGEITNLGRGGSDYTASIIAAALDASILEIWSDVDGFMTADPDVANTAYVINNLSFVEAIELCNFGMKTIYPPTIYPVYHKEIPIPIHVRNTFNPEAKGTLISNDKSVNDKGKAIKGISSVNDTCLITVQGLGMVGVVGVNYRIFRTLAKAGVSVFFVSQAASENTTSIGVRSIDADLAVKELNIQFEKEIESGEINPAHLDSNLATIAIVGENMKHTPGIAGKLFGTLGSNGINVIACAQGASETNISFVVKSESLKKAMNVIHDSFFLSDFKVLNIYIAGVGLVGKNLLEQIHMQQPTLMKNSSLKIKVVGITNSRKFITNSAGIDLANYQELLERSENVSTPEQFRDQIINMNIFNSVFVDCTASADVASIYLKLLEGNVSVVTANKVAASSEYITYNALKTTARKRGAKFLFETNVGAGLPIINTISDLINSGDKILKIEAVVSGTLNYIFNVMSEQVPMSKAIQMAKEAGYAEPDPRIDLSGTDVIRKLVILAREAGYMIEQSDVQKKLFIPNDYFEGSVEEFWANISNVDAEFETKRKELERQNRQWKFVAKLDNGSASVELKEVDNKSPFFDLEGSNNVVSLTTERYKEYPMQIKGYGAGASVTAAGIFADIISIANI